MLRGWLWVGGLMLLSTALILLMRWVFAQAPPPSLILVAPDADCLAPCWAGVRTVVAGDIEAEVSALPNVQMRAAGVWRLENEAGGGVWITRARGLQFSPQGLRLGDVLAAWGKPSYMRLNFEPTYTPDPPLMAVELFYEGPQITLLLLQGPLDGRLKASTPVHRLYYPDTYFGRPFYGLDWAGLAHNWRLIEILFEE